MPRQHINGIELYYELAGHGDTLVTVHGDWVDHTSWQLVVPGLAEHFRVLTYDRRGHSRSERPVAQGARRSDEDDLAALIETLDLAPAHLVGNSYGASISLGVAARRPELVRSVIAHEPPLLDAADPSSALGAEISRIRDLLFEIGNQAGDGEYDASAARFVEEVVLGRGMWEALPLPTRQVMAANAPTFVDTIGDPHCADVPIPSGDSIPVLLTDGEASPSWLPGIVGALAASWYRHASRHTFPGAGHAPHVTHATQYLTVVRNWIDGMQEQRPFQRSDDDDGRAV
jgi:pimeloyl-ACP methyl ester carboxylesterase